MKTYYILGTSENELSEEDIKLGLGFVTLHCTNDKSLAINISKEHTKKTSETTYIVELIAKTEMKPETTNISDNDY